MDTKINVYLVRHAESVGNVNKGNEQQDDTYGNGLTDRGKQQACRLGKSLSEVEFTGVYSSHYRRALETAEIVLMSNTGNMNGQKMEIVLSDQLREIDLGNLQNASYTDITKYFVGQKKPYLEWASPDGESVRDVGARMLKYVEHICSSTFQSCSGSSTLKNILIVSHSAAIAALLLYLSVPECHPHEIINWNSHSDLKLVKNACYYRFQISKSNLSKLNTGLKIDFMEKFVSSHMQGDDDGKQNDKMDKDKSCGDEAHLRNFLLSSKEGKDFLRCCQQ